MCISIEFEQTLLRVNSLWVQIWSVLAGRVWPDLRHFGFLIMLLIIILIILFFLDFPHYHKILMLIRNNKRIVVDGRVESAQVDDLSCSYLGVSAEEWLQECIQPFLFYLYLFFISYPALKSMYNKKNNISFGLNTGTRRT